MLSKVDNNSKEKLTNNRQLQNLRMTITTLDKFFHFAKLLGKKNSSLKLLSAATFRRPEYIY